MLVISTLARRLHTAFDFGLREAIGRHQQAHRGSILLLNLLWLRLQRLLKRFDRLVLRVERDLPLKPRAKRPAPARNTPKPEIRLSTAHGWLVKLVPLAHIGVGSVSALLQDPETRALAAATPQAGRLLRPLCRLIGLEIPDYLQLPRRPRKPRAPKPRQPRPRLRPISFTRAQIDKMTPAELTWIYGRMPPHFNLPIPNFNYIRRKIAAG